MTIEPWVVRQKIEIPFKYTAGPALTHFFASLREKVIYAGRCSGCNRKSVPPLSFCGRCWKPVEDMVRLPDRGRLQSFALVPHAVEELPEAESPVVFGLIRLDGADNNLAHVVHVESVYTLGVGAKVQAVWRPQRTGSILDIKNFRVLP